MSSLQMPHSRRLLCLRVRRFEEFYYPALVPGEHVLSYPEADADKLRSESAPRIKQVLWRATPVPASRGVLLEG